MSTDQLLFVMAVGAWIVAPVFQLLLHGFANWLDHRDAEREYQDLKRRKHH